MVKCAIYSQGKIDFLLVNSSKVLDLAKAGRAYLFFYVADGGTQLYFVVFCRGLTGWVPLVKSYRGL